MLAEMGKKERTQVIARLVADGWNVRYEKRGRMWIMERETVVKDWGRQVTGKQPQ